MGLLWLVLLPPGLIFLYKKKKAKNAIIEANRQPYQVDLIASLIVDKIYTTPGPGENPIQISLSHFAGIIDHVAQSYKKVILNLALYNPEQDILKSMYLIATKYPNITVFGKDITPKEIGPENV